MTILKSLLRPVSRFALAAGLAGVVGFAAPAAVSFAQDAPSADEGRRGHRGAHGRRGARGHGGRGHHMGRMFADLDLTEAQQTQIRAIFEAHRANRGADGAAGERGAVRAQVQAVLTPAQRARAEELRQEHAQARVERRVTGMTRRLELSETQASQVRGILRNSAMQSRALREQASPSSREAMGALRESTQASIRSVLNSSQEETFDAMAARRAEHHANRGARRGGEAGEHGQRGRRGGEGRPARPAR